MVQYKNQIILIISFIRHYFRILNQEKLNKYPTNLADNQSEIKEEFSDIQAFS